MEVEMTVFVNAGISSIGENLLPASGVVFHPRLFGRAWHEDATSRTLQPPGRLPEHIHGPRLVNQTVHIRSFFGQDGHGHQIVLQRDRRDTSLQRVLANEAESFAHQVSYFLLLTCALCSRIFFTSV